MYAPPSSGAFKQPDITNDKTGVLDTFIGSGRSLVAGLLAGAAAMTASSEALAQEVRLKATIGGVEQTLNLDDPRVVREVVPVETGSGYQTNYWVRTGEKAVRSSIEYPIPSEGAVTAGATYTYNGQVQVAQGAEVAWQGKTFVIDSLAVIATPVYGEVSTYGGASYDADASRFFAYNLYQWKTAEDVAATHLLPLAGESHPNTLAGKRSVERYVSQGAERAISGTGNVLNIEDQGDGKILIRATYSGSMVMQGTGFVAINAESPLFSDFAGFRLKTSSAPSLDGFRSIGVNSEGSLFYNDIKPAWRNARAYSVPMSTTLSEVVPAEVVNVDVTPEAPVISGIQLKGDGTFEISFSNLGPVTSSSAGPASVASILPGGYVVQCTTNMLYWADAELQEVSPTNAVIKPSAAMESSGAVFFRLYKKPQ